MFVEKYNLELQEKDVHREKGKSSFKGMHRNPGTVLGDILERVKSSEIEKSYPSSLIFINAGIKIGVAQKQKIYDQTNINDGIIEIVNGR